MPTTATTKIATINQQFAAEQAERNGLLMQHSAPVNLTQIFAQHNNFYYVNEKNTIFTYSANTKISQENFPNAEALAKALLELHKSGNKVQYR